MKPPKTISKNIRRHIVEWGKHTNRLVVAIDGYSGSGKTTIADILADQSANTVVIHMDDFVKHRNVRKRLMMNAPEKDKSGLFESSWYRYREVIRIVRAFKRGRVRSIRAKVYDFDTNTFVQKTIAFPSHQAVRPAVFIIEGVFLLHPRNPLAQLFDKRVYLDTNFTQADTRRIAREKKKWGKAYVPETHKDNWTRYFKKAYRQYARRYNPARKADISYTT